MRPKIRGTLVASAALSLTLAATSAAPASAQVLDFKIDHFRCYVTTSRSIDERVRLQDQFDRQINPNFFENVLVGRAVRFCNPVEKTVVRSGVVTVTPIKNPESHLTLYRILPDDLDLAPVRKVVIQNQFGKKTIRTFDPIALAVPTQKNNEGAPHDLDHFKCYRAYGGSLNRSVRLKDQFLADGVRVQDPVIFCNPTVKIHDDVVTPIRNEEDHLACYRTTRKPFDRFILAINQFGAHDLPIREANMLCVPSKKLSVSIP